MMITDVSKKYGISVDTLRYYERIGLIPPVNRNESGYRDYTEEDCEWVYFAVAMRSAGISVEALIEYVDLFQKVLERLDRKIDGYEERILKYEEKLKNRCIK